MKGHRARLRNVMGQYYPIYACTRANHARYSLLQVKALANEDTLLRTDCYP